MIRRMETFLKEQQDLASSPHLRGYLVLASFVQQMALPALQTAKFGAKSGPRGGV